MELSFVKRGRVTSHSERIGKNGIVYHEIGLAVDNCTFTVSPNNDKAFEKLGKSVQLFEEVDIKLGYTDSFNRPRLLLVDLMPFTAGKADKGDK